MKINYCEFVALSSFIWHKNSRVFSILQTLNNTKCLILNDGSTKIRHNKWDAQYVGKAHKDAKSSMDIKW